MIEFFRSQTCSEDMEKVVPSTAEDVNSVLARFWCLSAKKVVQCNSHSDKVFLVSTADERQYILKVHHPRIKSLKVFLNKEIIL